MAHLLFGFRDLVNPNPNASVFDVTSILLDDSYLKSINPQRYNFYIKFVAGLSNPAVLEQFFYKTKEAKDYREGIQIKAKHLAKLIDRLNNNFNDEDRNRLIEDITATIKKKFKFDERQIETIEEVMKTKKGGDGDKSDILRTMKLNKGYEPMKSFVEKVNKIAPDLTEKPPARDVIELLDPSLKTTKTNPEVIKSLKNVYDKYRDNLSPAELEIKMVDRIIFIITTFIIVQISLRFVDWGLSSNIINDFKWGFLMYSAVYICFFVFVTMVVNVVVFYPVMELFTSSSIITIPNVLYYFYIYTNGFGRILLHLFIIILLLFVPYVINIDKLTFSWLNNNNDTNVSADFDKKQRIYNSIYLFSHIIWLLTSVIALKF